jgi:tripartite-type tricarboxylate transporter receptor subunit TctC
VPFPAGGAADLGARAVAVQLSSLFGKPVPVENRAGADGAVAALEVIKSPADGHSLYFGTATSMSYTPSIRKSPPYDPVADFTPISNVCVFTFYFAVAPTVPANTLAEFVAHVKANPGKLAYASGNSTGILASAQLVASNKLEMTHVPYKGEAQAVIDLVGGRVQAMFATPAVLPQLLERKFRLLAVLLPQRTRAFPEVPTMTEAGQPLVNISPWGGLFGPAKLPRELVDRISRDFNVVMRRPDVVEQFDKLGLLPLPSSPDELAGIVRDQLGVFSRAMREAGIQQE